MHRQFNPRARRWGADNRLLIPCEFCGRHFLVAPSSANRKYCGWRCFQAHLAQRRTIGLAQRFWSKVAKADGCWLWQALRDRHGYGKFGMRLGAQWSMYYAHRVAWELTHGPVPAHLRVLHRCDNPPCCNPAHLFLGTPADNTHDMMAKGRQVMGPQSRFLARPEENRGERNPQARYTDAQVREMRGL